MRSNRHWPGFTLIELLLALTLFVIASASLYLSLRSGLLLYARSEEGQRVRHETVLFMNTLSRELRNAVPYATVPFEGSERTLRMPIVVMKYDDIDPYADIVTLEYEYRAGRLLRKETSLSEKKAKTTKRTILPEHLKKFSLAYGFFDADEKTIYWDDQWSPEEQVSLPQAIRVRATITYDDPETRVRREQQLERKIWIPHGIWGTEA